MLPFSLPTPSRERLRQGAVIGSEIRGRRVGWSEQEGQWSKISFTPLAVVLLILQLHSLLPSSRLWLSLAPLLRAHMLIPPPHTPPPGALCQCRLRNGAKSTTVQQYCGCVQRQERSLECDQSHWSLRLQAVCCDGQLRFAF